MIPHRCKVSAAILGLLFLLNLKPSFSLEFKDDSQIIPRSSSVIVKRMPASRPGKGKASLYVAAANVMPTSEPLQRSGHSNTQTASWHKGAMSKRFDGKDEQPVSAKSAAHATSSSATSSITKEDEQAAMAAMFQAQTANWEETQEKMSQFVLPFAGFCQYSSSMSNEHLFVFFVASFLHCSA